MDHFKLKTIVYRGGVATFRIPTDWQEEYEPSGGGTFYAPGDETGTLRLNVTTVRVRADRILDAHDAEDFLLQFSAKYRVPVQTLRPGVAMIRYDLPAAERGHKLLIRYWQIAQVIPPHHIRQSLFSYTILARLSDDWLIQQELAMLEGEVSAATFAPEVGVPPR
jgi:hypothetical protein